MESPNNEASVGLYVKAVGIAFSIITVLAAPAVSIIYHRIDEMYQNVQHTNATRFTAQDAAALKERIADENARMRERLLILELKTKELELRCGYMHTPEVPLKQGYGAL